MFQWVLGCICISAFFEEITALSFTDLEFTKQNMCVLFLLLIGLNICSLLCVFDNRLITAFVNLQWMRD